MGLSEVAEQLGGTTTWSKRDLGTFVVANPESSLRIMLLHPGAEGLPLRTIGIRWAGDVIRDGIPECTVRRGVDISYAFLRGAANWIALPADLRGEALYTPALALVERCLGA